MQFVSKTMGDNTNFRSKFDESAAAFRACGCSSTEPLAGRGGLPQGAQGRNTCGYFLAGVGIARQRRASR